MAVEKDYQIKQKEDAVEHNKWRKLILHTD